MKCRRKIQFLFLLFLIFLVPITISAKEKYELSIDEFILYDDFYSIYQDSIKMELKHKSYETYKAIGSMNFESEIKYQNGETVEESLWHLETFSIQHRYVLSTKWKVRLKSELAYDHHYDPLFRNTTFSNAITFYYYYNLFFYLKLEFQLQKEYYTESSILDNRSKQLLLKIMKRQSVFNSYYIMLIAGERNLPFWPIPNVSSVSNRVDSNFNLVFSNINSVTKKIFNEFNFQLEFYKSNINAYELYNIGPYFLFEFPDDNSETRKLINDYFNYYLRKFSNVTTFILPKDYIFQLSLTYQLKDYQSKNARNELGVIKKTKEWDEQYNFSVNIMKNKLFSKKISLKFGMLYQVSSSNNKFNQYYLYDGERYLFTLGISWRM